MGSGLNNFIKDFSNLEKTLKKYLEDRQPDLEDHGQDRDGVSEQLEEHPADPRVSD